jgi:hypothetical protein
VPYSKRKLHDLRYVRLKELGLVIFKHNKTRKEYIESDQRIVGYNKLYESAWGLQVDDPLRFERYKYKLICWDHAIEILLTE